jgi:hypothetical protein
MCVPDWKPTIRQCSRRRLPERAVDLRGRGLMARSLPAAHRDRRSRPARWVHAALACEVFQGVQVQQLGDERAAEGEGRLADRAPAGHACGDPHGGPQAMQRALLRPLKVAPSMLRPSSEPPVGLGAAAGPRTQGGAGRRPGAGPRHGPPQGARSLPRPGPGGARQPIRPWIHPASTPARTEDRPRYCGTVPLPVPLDARRSTPAATRDVGLARPVNMPTERINRGG